MLQPIKLSLEFISFFGFINSVWPVAGWIDSPIHNSFFAQLNSAKFNLSKVFLLTEATKTIQVRADGGPE
jgi:hypothetical protein